MRESDSSDPFMESPGWKLGGRRGRKKVKVNGAILPSL